jgi:hypothetical protein
MKAPSAIDIIEEAPETEPRALRGLCYVGVAE